MNMLEHLQSVPIVARLGWTLLHTVWQGTAAALLLWLILRPTRERIGAAWSNIRHAAAWMALIAVVAAAVATFLMLGNAAPAQVSIEPLLAARTSAEIFHVNPTPTFRAFTPHDLIPAAVLLWMAGVLAQGAWQLAGWIAVQRLRRGGPVSDAIWNRALSEAAEGLGFRRAVRLVLSPRIDVPAVVGILRPAILVPVALLGELTLDQVRSILTHELAHIRRFDYAANLIQTAIETIFFHHPGVWWISAQIRRERENCCDDIAARLCGPEIYARSLLALEERRGIRLAPGAADGSLLFRIRRLLGKPAHRRRQNRSVLIAAAALLCVLGPLSLQSMPRAHAQEAPATRPSSDYTPYRVTIGADGFIAVNGAVGNWDTLARQLGDLSPAERKKVVIAVAAETDDLPVGKYIEAQGRAQRLVDDLGLAYVSEAGADRAGNGKEVGVIYISGDVARPGVYQIQTGAHHETVRQQIMAAGINSDSKTFWIVLIRRNNNGQTRPLDGISIDADLSNDSLDFYMEPDDIVQVLNHPPEPASAP